MNVSDMTELTPHHFLKEVCRAKTKEFPLIFDTMLNTKSGGGLIRRRLTATTYVAKASVSCLLI